MTSVYRQFSDLGQALISGIGGLYWDQLLHLLQNITDPESDHDLENIHDIINSCNDSLKDLTRENLLDSAAFRDPAVLGRANLSGNAVELGFANDAALRAKNLTLRVCFIVRSHSLTTDSQNSPTCSPSPNTNVHCVLQGRSLRSYPESLLGRMIAF